MPRLASPSTKHEHSSLRRTHVERLGFGGHKNSAEYSALKAQLYQVIDPGAKSPCQCWARNLSTFSLWDTLWARRCALSPSGARRTGTEVKSHYVETSGRAKQQLCTESNGRPG